MASRKGINISGHYIVSINSMPFHVLCTLDSNKSKGRTKSYYILFFKLNGHPTGCFNFGLSRIHSNGCKFELNLKKTKSKIKHF